MSERLFNGPQDAPYTLLLAHGSGAGMDTVFMESFANGLGERGIRIVRFEFPYMKKIRETGRRRPPNPMLLLRSAFLSEIDRIPGRVVIGGKSMGGRVASMILMESKAEGCIALGYPFHPPGKPLKLRVDHFVEITKPYLIIQGTRDPFGKPEENPESYLSKHGRIHWLLDGDHSFSTRKSSSKTTSENLDEAVEEAERFCIAL